MSLYKSRYVLRMYITVSILTDLEYIHRVLATLNKVRIILIRSVNKSKVYKLHVTVIIIDRATVRINFKCALYINRIKL